MEDSVYPVSFLDQSFHNLIFILVDENYLKDNSQISPISVSTTDSLSPRSSSEPPKRRLAARRRITKNLNCSESESDIMVENEDNENVESGKIFSYMKN